MGLISILTEWLYTISLAAGGAIMARLLLAYFDLRAGGHFKHWIDNAEGIELSIYYAARFIGVCLLFGLALS